MYNSEDNKSSCFIFGLTLGAAIGALSAILINKNSETEVIQNFESKIKDFFQDLIDGVQSKKTEISKKIKLIDTDEEIIKPTELVKNKTHPKMFIKARK